MKRSDIKKLIYFASIVLVALTVIFSLFSSYEAIIYDERIRDYESFSSGWLDENGKAVQLDTLTESGRLHKKLPIVEHDMMLSFNARNIDVDVYIDDICVYKKHEESDPFLKAIYGKTGGSAFVDIRMLKEYGGKTMYIDVDVPYSNPKACKIVHMYFGDGVQIVKHNASVQLGAFCFAIIILFLGVACLLLYIPMRKNKMAETSMLYLGIGAFVFGMSMMTDSKMLHLIVGQESLYYTLSQMFMLLIPVPILAYFSKLYDNLNPVMIIIFGVSSVLDFILIFILDCLGICDYHDNAPAILLIIGGTIVYVGYATVKDIIKNGNRHKFHNIGVLMIVVSCVLDSIAERSDVFMETSFFMKFGIAGFTSMECTQVLWNHIKNYQKGVKAQLVSRLAYHDGLTDLLNRTSFIEDMDKLKEDKTSNILIGVFDVNNLKYVNDNFGHTSGDELIITAANAIQENFGSFGKCYRTGGDEFILLSTSIAAESNFAAACKKMVKELEELNENSSYPISVASGYSMRKSEDQDLIRVLNEADERMYENKKKLKESMELPEASKIA